MYKELSVVSGKIFAFVLMPFGAEFQDTYRLGIKAAAEEQGILAERVDEQFFHKEGILTRIYEQIKIADMIIADMTGRNPNVFYEVGYAHALGKNCLLITSKSDDIPFDLKHHRHIIYGSSITKLKDDLARDISFLKTEILEKKRPFGVEFGNVFGLLDKEEVPSWNDKTKVNYYCYAEIYFTLKVYNDSDKPSSEIDDLYLYTAKGWKITQDKIACIEMESDISKYSVRHVIRCPHKRVTKGSWIEVRFIGKKLLETSKEPIAKESYSLKGSLNVRINTIDDTYDMQIPLLVECNDIPF